MIYKEIFVVYDKFYLAKAYYTSLWTLLSLCLLKNMIPLVPNQKIARAFSKQMWKMLGFIEIFRFHMYGKTPYADRLRTGSVIGIILD